jgi:hypothetical protein
MWNIADHKCLRFYIPYGGYQIISTSEVVDAWERSDDDGLEVTVLVELASGSEGRVEEIKLIMV